MALTHILTGAPVWVYAIFCLLLVLGLMQVRSRIVSARRLLALPVAMLVLSASSVVVLFGTSALAMIFWVAGVAGAIWIRSWVFHPQEVVVQDDPAQAFVRGSWLPLVLLIVLFSLKFIAGAAQALQVSWLGAFWFVVLYAAVCGMVSGLFFARILPVWHALLGDSHS